MRAMNRQAFLQEIEDALREQQELARIEAEEQERLAEIEREANELRSIAVTVLAHFNLERYVDRFLASGDGLALLANCCNYAAKCHDDALYEHKPTLINLATTSGLECWQNDGIVYLETPVGQVSFHALYGEDEGLPEANGRVWSELEYQFNADLVAIGWLHGWSQEEIISKIEAYKDAEEDEGEIVCGWQEQDEEIAA